MSPRTVALIGSTGSIGTQALEVIAAHSDALRVVGLAAGGSRPDVIIEQARRWQVSVVAVAHDGAAAAVARQLPGVEVLAGLRGVAEVAGCGADVVLNGMTGSAGLDPTLAALAAGSTLALANKESLVAGGALVMDARLRPDQIVPVDSEHSALAQALAAGRRDQVRRLIVTASGGAFRTLTRDQMRTVTAAQALRHPTWDMGPVVTINSATMMNKALEVIEAHMLFDIPMDRIEVVVHPQSVVHSMVEFVDGSTLAQASPPDMKLPIAWGLSWPERLHAVAEPVDWTRAQQWDFAPLDAEVFPAVTLAREAVAASPLHPAAMNAANEECVAAFVQGNLGFVEIVDTVRRVLDELSMDLELSRETIGEVEQWARLRAQTLIAEMGS